MTERQEKSKVLSDSDTTKNVSWYDNQMPVKPEHRETQLYVNGKRVELTELNEADWIILRALYPRGPQRLD
jgi:hypothetical protein